MDNNPYFFEYNKFYAVTSEQKSPAEKFNLAHEFLMDLLGKPKKRFEVRKKPSGPLPIRAEVEVFEG